MAIDGFKLALSVLNFVGSLASAIGSGFILLCYLVLPLRKHFRHVLIINLAMADFINSFNNSVSGAHILVHRRDLTPGPGCVLNGFVGQISVQATDCAIFAIALVTVMTITQANKSRLISGEWEWSTIALATASIWLLPVITSFTALGKGWYVPVSGNWCWLTSTPVYLRYALTHGWRYLFMLCEVGLYTYLHFYLRRHFRMLAIPIISQGSQATKHTSRPVPLMPITFANNNTQSSDTQFDSQGSQTKSKAETLNPPTPNPEGAQYTMRRQSEASSHNPFSPSAATEVPSSPEPLSATPLRFSEGRTSSGSSWKAKLPFQHIMSHRSDDLELNNNRSSTSTSPRHRAIQRILLLNAYPLLYIILWIPGLANRIVEATGNKSRVTAILQASTQFVGLANALTYGWNERIARQLKKKFRPSE
ncbi:hypothetical protein HGRIS_010077 [Hohenbuehelia grisea]|uniref:Glucose receptor Git3-like N-terminal domain-containing protein n=1 Tax=Hohenbuehelia grisea TaxID=104357 RepID=A0ABR3J379_9AGAR